MSKRRDIVARIGIVILCVGASIEVSPEAPWFTVAITTAITLSGMALIGVAAYLDAGKDK